MKKSYLSLVLIFLVTCLTSAQDLVMPVWLDEVPYSKPSDIKELTDTINDIVRTRNVKNATLSFYFPEENLNGTSVLICPGGGYSILARGHEGEDIAKWLNSFGVTGIVLKYRLPDTTYVTNRQLVPVTDALEAMRILRLRTRRLGLTPWKIGIMGFSAGGHLASTVLTHYNKETITNFPDVNARPDFGILIYPVISMNDEITHQGSRNNLIGTEPTESTIKDFSGEENVDKQTPPVFIVHAGDDQAVDVSNSIHFFEALNEKGVQAELHIYPYGGHGFGLAKDKPGVSQWPDQCMKWLKNYIIHK